MKPKAGYRGIEYVIQRRGERNWEWAYYPKKGEGKMIEGRRERYARRSGQSMQKEL